MVGLIVYWLPITAACERISNPARVVLSRLPSKRGGLLKSATKYLPKTECFALCCQSPRETIWFSLFGFGIEYVNRPHGSLDVGRLFSRATAGALKLLVGIWLLA